MTRDFKQMAGLVAAAAALCAATAAHAASPAQPVRCKLDGLVCRDPGALNEFIPVNKASAYLRTVAEAVVVTLPLAPEGAEPLPAAAVDDSTRSDAAGAFSFDNLPSGAYTLTIQAAGFRTRTLDVTLTADESVFMQLVDEGTFARIQGTVKAVHCYGIPGAGLFPCVPRPLPACTVWAALPEELPPYSGNTSGTPAPLTALQTIAGAGGAYVIDSVPLAFSGQRVVVWTRAEGVDPVSVDTVVANGRATTVDFALQPSSGAVISLDTPRRRAQPAGPVSYSERDRLLSVHLERSQVISIEAFVLSGRRDGRLSAKRAFKAGIYRFSLDNPRLGAGVIIVRVQGEDFADTRRIVLPEKK